MQERRAEVIVVGGGPAGSVLAWDLARRGVRVLLLERTRFPREKVCGDYVEPRGLRILKTMGCLERLEASKPLPISRSATFVEWDCRYSGPLPFYGLSDSLPPHGYIISRDELDAVTLDAAARAGAIVHEETAVTNVSAGSSGVEVRARRGPRTTRYRAHLMVGADGVNSTVAQSQGLSVADPRRIAVARRAYAVADGEIGEAVFFFHESLFPGYGWMFPMAQGRVNLGVGILSETRRRLGVHVPALFTEFVDGLRRCHPRCGGLELCSQPIGGIVKTYGGAGCNHFDGGLLVGDAGSFVDPMTGECGRTELRGRTSPWGQPNGRSGHPPRVLVVVNGGRRRDDRCRHMLVALGVLLVESAAGRPSVSRKTSYSRRREPRAPPLSRRGWSGWAAFGPYQPEREGRPSTQESLCNASSKPGRDS